MHVDDASTNQWKTDAVIIGGGLSGLASAIHLARGCMRVVLLEPQTVMPPIVGESLDWSAPALLRELGLPMEELISSRAATWKRHIVLHQPDGSRQEYQPGAWLKQRPWNVEVRTLHLDRPQVHTATKKMAAELGVTVLHQKAVSFTQNDDRLISVQTADGHSIQADWFVDASGADSSVLARRFRLRSHTYGPRKVALWAHLPVEDQPDGTNLHMLSPATDYMEWIWDIPIRSGVSSVGYVLPGPAMKVKRASGNTNAEIFQQALRAFPRLRPLAETQGAAQPCSTSFLCRSYRDTCGPNWIIVGEAASQSDPITGNGVTAALRHAAEAARILLACRGRRRIPLAERRAYSLRVVQMGRFFNSLIEKLFYQPQLRVRINVFTVARVYTVPAWLANLAYTRTAPAGYISSVVFTSVLASLRGAAWATQRTSRSHARRNASSLRAPHANGKQGSVPAPHTPAQSIAGLSMSTSEALATPALRSR